MEVCTTDRTKVIAKNVILTFYVTLTFTFDLEHKKLMVSILDEVEASLKNWSTYLENCGQETLTLTFDLDTPKLYHFFLLTIRTYPENFMIIRS